MALSTWAKSSGPSECAAQGMATLMVVTTTSSVRLAASFARQVYLSSILYSLRDQQHSGWQRGLLSLGERGVDLAAVVVCVHGGVGNVPSLESRLEEGGGRIDPREHLGPWLRSLGSRRALRGGCPCCRPCRARRRRPPKSPYSGSARVDGHHPNTGRRLGRYASPSRLVRITSMVSWSHRRSYRTHEPLSGYP